MSAQSEPLTLSEKLGLAADGLTLTLPQQQRLARTLTRRLKEKTEDEITVPELQGMIEIVVSILPSELYWAARR
ncbi:hypothetical protein EYC87_15585 [Halieaceae bacterium IMCC8485]|uniref:Uncharacterized protein n=1 Tax=Candidatus Seongchinamella marina TaxID=2518990 RepID=A0ABT3SYC8_9GAMM|nr:hypothetical protein [Candidatus Seongchinamella marina]MCX2975012.1 hypothetical protein [Candidatus Seongchinamella marina]